jgi:predicted dehydrogenase
MNRRNFLSHSAATVAATALLAQRGIAADAVAAAPASTTYAPGPKPGKVVQPGEFVFAAANCDHAHINGQCSNLMEAGATLKWIFEPDARKLAAFQRQFPMAKAAKSLDEILADKEVKLVTGAAVTSERGAIGCRVMEAGKDYFVDKAPFTTLAQLEQARVVAAKTKQRYMVSYSERLQSEAGMFATDLLAQGVIGRVVHVMGLGPHRLNKASRPDWFFVREKFGGILCDIGSHQCEQFLTYASAKDATVTHATIGNFNNPDKPEFEDFGEATFVADNGATNQIRVDWYTPAGLSTWGDGRTFILGTKGYIEMRKYVDVGRARGGGHVYIVDDKGEHHIEVTGKVGYRFFGEFILDCLNRTEKAMTQTHAFKAAELCLKAQAFADALSS